MLNQNDKIEVALRVVTTAPSGWLDRALDTPVQPATLTLQMPDILGDRAAIPSVRTSAPSS